jgi:hypothetical protein
MRIRDLKFSHFRPLFYAKNFGKKRSFTHL